MNNTFASFGGFHPQRSSNVSLQPLSGIVKKQKERAAYKARQEYFSLHLWERVLAHYNSTYTGVHLLSPKPIAVIPEEGSVTMTYLPGSDFSRLSERENNDETLMENMGFQLGALFRIKEVEGLEHSDMQIRHVITLPDESTLGVIDIENARVNRDVDRIKHENRLLVNQILQALPSKKIRTVFTNGIEKGRGVFPTSVEPVIIDAIKSIERDLGLKSSKYRLKAN